MYEICSELKKRQQEDVINATQMSIVNFEQILHTFLVFSSLTLSK